MAGVSLKCGDCGTLLKSVEEAQEHAELTKHSNFVESTEAVLNLVCSDCGKPCRSKTESDLHTKRTGHTEFVDKTSEAAKPISLEAPKPKDDVEMEDAGEGSGSKKEEMVVPEVNQQLLAELEEMGFPKERATRALHFSGNVSLEAAANWIVEHENDADIDQMPLVPVSSNKPVAPKPSLTPEEIKQKQQELRERARKKKEEEEKRMEREREKERIRVGRELLEAKRIEEENERKRLLALRKAEKEEERRAREKIRQKLEEDKAERRRKLGLPPEDPAAVKPSAPPVEEKKSSLPVRPATKAEQMRECLRTLKQTHKDEDAKVKTAFNTLLTFAKNVATNPNEEKFRKIRLTNANIQERVGKMKGGIEFLELCGFEKIEGGEFLYLPREKVDMAVLHSAGNLDMRFFLPFPLSSGLSTVRQWRHFVAGSFIPFLFFVLFDFEWIKDDFMSSMRSGRARASDGGSMTVVINGFKTVVWTLPLFLLFFYFFCIFLLSLLSHFMGVSIFL